MFCIKCNLAINELVDKVIKCDGCGRPIHIACSDLSATELKCFDLRSNAKRRIKYMCLDCERAIQQLPKLIGLVEDLRNDVRKLQERDSSSSVVTDFPKSSALATEEIMTEMLERNKRSYNVIIYGSGEDADNKNNQIERDSATVQNILREVGLGDSTNVRPIRLGKFISSNQNRSRPIKVRLSSPDDVATVLRKFKKAKNQNAFAGLSVSPDRTPKQIAFYKLVKNELNSRVELGETNLKIKHINGIPTVVAFKPEN